MSNRIVFRVDGGHKIGMGHLVRSMALAEMLTTDFTCIFWLKDPSDRVLKIIEDKFSYKILPAFATPGEEVKNLQSLLNRSDILVLDGYQFDSAYQRSLKPFVKKMICVDDLAETHFYADLIINHGNPDSIKRYETEPYAKISIGPEYALLREPFRKTALQNRKEFVKIDTVFICMGGSDPFNVTNKVLKAALQLDFINKIIVVTGSAYRFQEEMKEILAGYKHTKEVLIEREINAERLIALIQTSHLAICPSSSIALEVASVKCGFLTGTVINNQQGIHDMFIQNNCAKSAGDFNSLSEEELCLKIVTMNDVDLVNTLMKNQSKLIDGLSGQRILEEIKILNKC